MLFSIDNKELSVEKPDSCLQVEVLVSVGNTNGIASTGKAEVSVKGAKAPILYFFSEINGHMVDDNYKVNRKEFLKAGKYVCTIKEAGGCRKKIEFEIK